MADRTEITPKLQNATITVPAKTVDSLGASHWYLSNSVKSVATSITLKADEGYTFESDGTIVYQGSYDEQTDPITASHTDTVVFKLPDFDWNDQFNPIVLTMSATKKATPAPAPTTPTTPTPTQPTEPVNPAPTAPAKAVTTPLDVLKNSLRIPLDLKDDDKLLQSYIDGASEYLRSTLDSNGDVEAKLGSKRARVVVNALAELLYQNRGDNTMTKGLPYTLQALINQLKY